MVVDAVCRNLEIIGEAASKLDDEFRQLHGEVPKNRRIYLIVCVNQEISRSGTFRIWRERLSRC
jgi:hypothetical protein